jgi:hypothetical protein
MHGPDTPALYRTQQAPAPGRPGRRSRPIDRAVEAAARGKLIVALCNVRTMETSRRTTGSSRAFARHGHIPHTRKIA